MNRIDRIAQYLTREFHCKPGEAKTHAQYILGLTRYGQRSEGQNSYYWAVVIAITANQYGYEPEEMHEAWKHQFLTVQEPGKPARIRSTASLSTVEAEEYYERIRRFAAQDGCYVPEPNE